MRPLPNRPVRHLIGPVRPLAATIPQTSLHSSPSPTTLLPPCLPPCGGRIRPHAATPPRPHGDRLPRVAPPLRRRNLPSCATSRGRRRGGRRLQRRRRGDPADARLLQQVPAGNGLLPARAFSICSTFLINWVSASTCELWFCQRLVSCSSVYLRSGSWFDRDIV